MDELNRDELLDSKACDVGKELEKLISHPGYKGRKKIKAEAKKIGDALVKQGILTMSRDSVPFFKKKAQFNIP